jgi:gag-polypeptide of LTR copia-type
MTSTKEGEHTIKVVLFSGRQHDWKIWEEKFMARAKRKGYRDLMLGRVPIPKSDDDLMNEDDDTIDETKVKARDMNDSAYSDLILSMDTTTSLGRVAFAIVKGSKSGDYLDGNAATSWSKLKQKYAPTTNFALATLHKKYHGAKLKRGGDPDLFVTYIHDLRFKLEDMNVVFTERQFLLHILSNLNEDYGMVQYHLEHRLGSTDEDNQLTVDELTSELNAQYARLQDKKGVSTHDGDDRALFSGGKFRGKCNKCGQYGHKASQCSDNSAHSSVNKSTLACTYCKKKGHTEAQCFKKRRDANNKNDTANAANDEKPEKKSGRSKKGKGNDVVLMAADFLPSFHPGPVPPSSSGSTSDDNDLGRVHREIPVEWGVCPQCGDEGPISDYCGECAEQCIMYELPHVNLPTTTTSIPPSDDITFDTRNAMAHAFSMHTLFEHALETPAHEELNTFLSFIGKAVSMDPVGNILGGWRSDYANIRKKWLTNIGVTTVKKLVAHVFNLNDGLKKNECGSFSLLECEAIVKWGTEWIVWYNPMHVPVRKTSIRHDEAKITVDSALAAPARKFAKNLWLGDSGASCHMTCNLAGMFDCVDIKSPVKIGNGKTLMATKLGKMRMLVLQTDGSSKEIILADCKYVEGLCVNLFSITKSLQNGWRISNDNLKISLSKQGHSVVFDQVIETETGVLVGVEMVPRGDHALAAFTTGRSIDAIEAHQLLGHANKEVVKRTVEHYGGTIKGEWETCADCPLAKAKQKAVTK